MYLKAPLPDFKNIEYKPYTSSKDFIKKVSNKFAHKLIWHISELFKYWKNILLIWGTNFVQGNSNQPNLYIQNAINVIKSSAKKGEPKYVDTVGGNSSPLKPSGLVPNVSCYLFIPDS